MVTPFVNDEVDLEGLRTNLRKLRTTGVTGYLALGSNGEFRSLSEKETGQITGTFAEEKGDKVLIVGAGCESTAVTIANCRRAAELGADYASLITPSYFPKFMTEEVMQRYFSSVADASPIPVMIYNIPGSTGGVQISPRVVAQLSLHPNIAGMKDSSPSGPAAFLAAVPEKSDFSVLSGSTNTFYPSLCIGAAGGVLSLANIIPEACVRLYQLFLNGEHAEAKKLHVALLKLNQAVSGKYGVAGVKAAMNAAGFRAGSPRLPLAALTEEETAGLARTFAEAGFPLV